MYLNKKNLKQAADLLVITGRIKELERMEPYVPSDYVVTRRKTLKKQLAELLGEEKETEDKAVIHIQLEIPEGKKEKEDKKSVCFNLKDLFKSKDNEEEGDSVVDAIRNLIDIDQSFLPRNVIGKVVDKL